MSPSIVGFVFFCIHITFRPGSYYSDASLQLFRIRHRYFGIFGLAVPILILCTVPIPMPMLTDILLNLWPPMPILVSASVHVMWVRAVTIVCLASKGKSGFVLISVGICSCLTDQANQPARWGWQPSAQCAPLTFTQILYLGAIAQS